FSLFPMLNHLCTSCYRRNISAGSLGGSTPGRPALPRTLAPSLPATPAAPPANRERLAWVQGGGNELPCSPAWMWRNLAWMLTLHPAFCRPTLPRGPSPAAVAGPLGSLHASTVHPSMAGPQHRCCCPMMVWETWRL